MLLTDFLRKGIAALEPLYPTAEARNIVQVHHIQYVKHHAYQYQLL